MHLHADDDFPIAGGAGNEAFRVWRAHVYKGHIKLLIYGISVYGEVEQLASWRKACRAKGMKAASFGQSEDHFFTILNFNRAMMILALSLATYLAFNLLVFLIYWWDKEAARKGEWRVAESTLLWLAFLGGSAGAVVAQRMLRHKTRKEPFRSILLFIVIVQLVLGASLIIMPTWPKAALHALETMAQKPKP
ncbi:DUF1294 domain-containing protein [Agrobacterium bohemicum]|uniref:DUF1294 domain-containing protein n=1 Tax=Agrobacterium bohemicum TaxID=2052828 RepID=UPI00315A3D9C